MPSVDLDDVRRDLEPRVMIGAIELTDVHSAVADVPPPHIRPDQGAILYEHIRRTRPARALELGTARGVSAAYIAAAMEANGEGHLVTVDSSAFPWGDPSPSEVLDRAGLHHRVSRDTRFSTYTWFLKDELARHTDEHGNTVPAYDFCFLDGAKNWTIDGLAVLLIERLLRPDGWLLLDDLDWSYSEQVESDAHYFASLAQLSAEEREEPHLRAVFDLLVKPHPSFTELRIQDEWWAWARKAPGEPRRLHVETSRSATSYAIAAARRGRRTLRRARARVSSESRRD
jgi:predicted O-methyltransferase YrrM